MANRLNINLNDQTAKVLDDLTAKRASTYTETVRRAISVLKFIEDEVVDKGHTLQVVNNVTGERTTLAVL